MSVVTIKSKCNLDTGSWTVDKTLLSHVSNEIGIGFENNSGTTVVFTDFSFYYKITIDGSIIFETNGLGGSQEQFVTYVTPNTVDNSV